MIMATKTTDCTGIGIIIFLIVESLFINLHIIIGISILWTALFPITILLILIFDFLLYISKYLHLKNKKNKISKLL